MASPPYDYVETRMFPPNEIKVKLNANGLDGEMASPLIRYWIAYTFLTQLDWGAAIYCCQYRKLGPFQVDQSWS